MDRSERKSASQENELQALESSKSNESPSTGLRLLRPNRKLAALTTSALALPGIATPARADAPIERASAAAAFSYYFEDDLPDEKFSGTGSQERYEILTQQVRFDVPVSDRFDIGIQYLYEEMSGASPWFVEADTTTGQELQVMSGATIEDERHDATIDLDYYMDRGKDTITAGFSLERDYTSMHYGLATERNFNDKNTVLNLSGAFSYDWIEPTDSDIFDTRPEEEEKWTIDLFAGLSQILSRSTAIQFTVNFKHSDGYLSDPYKAVRSIDPVSVLLSDERPDSRDQGTLLARLRHHYEPWELSTHLDYQLHADDWGIVSHAVELTNYMTFFDILTVSAGGRWYSQSQADFYEAVLPLGTPAAERSSDYRLSPYGAVSSKLRVDVELTDLVEYNPPRWLEAIGITQGLDLIASVSHEYYFSDGHLSVEGLKETDEAPGLVTFHIIAFTLNGRF